MHWCTTETLMLITGLAAVRYLYQAARDLFTNGIRLRIRKGKRW